MEQYIVTGMSCAACQARVEKAVAKVPGVDSVSVSLLTNSMGVEGNASSAEIIRAVEAAGYGASVKGAPAGQQASDSLAAQEEALQDRETPKLKRRLLLSVGFLAVLMYITMGHHMAGWPLPAFLTHNHLALTLTQMLLALIVMIINGKFFTSGFRSRRAEHGYAGGAGIIGLLRMEPVCVLPYVRNDHRRRGKHGADGPVSRTAVL